MKLKSGENEQDFVSRCMSELSKNPKDSDKEEDQKLAICYSKYANKDVDFDKIKKQLSNIYDRYV